MTDMPERIWAYMPEKGQHAVYKPASDATEYVRADLPPRLITAAQAVITRWDSTDWKASRPQAEVMNELRAALAALVQP